MEENKKHSNFQHSGISIIKVDLDIKITEDDMLRDLVDKTEGQNIPIDNINDN